MNPLCFLRSRKTRAYTMETEREGVKFHVYLVNQYPLFSIRFSYGFDALMWSSPTAGRHLEVRHLAILVAEGVEVDPEVVRLLPREAVLVARLHKEVVDPIEVEPVLLCTS